MNTVKIKEDKLKAAIQIALGSNGIYTEETESLLIHHIKALAITDVVRSNWIECDNCGVIKNRDSCVICGCE